jgi:hypothetical protein
LPGSDNPYKITVAMMIRTFDIASVFFLSR